MADPIRSRSAITFDQREEIVAEAPSPVSPRRRGLDHAGSRVSRPGRREARGSAAAREGLRPRPGRGVSEARRAWNGEHIGVVSELRCECAQPNCTDTVPAVAETHRGTAERFIVLPAHLIGGVVVRAADRFFVVEPAGLRPASRAADGDQRAAGARAGGETRGFGGIR